MKVKSGEISERFRKYVIKVVLPDRTSVFTLWGTDINNEDFDYLLIDTKGKIISFFTIPQLLRYIKNMEILVDKLNTKLWVEHYKENEEYTSYDLGKIMDILSVYDFNLNFIKREDAFSVVNFYNLFSDYAYQRKEKQLLDLINEKNTKLFFDFVYNSFFWTSTGQRRNYKVGG